MAGISPTEAKGGGQLTVRSDKEIWSRTGKNWGFKEKSAYSWGNRGVGI